MFANKTKFNNLKIYNMMFKVAPVAVIFTMLYYILNGLFPAFFVLITTELFQLIEFSFQSQVVAYSQMFLYCGLLIFLFFTKIVLSIIASISINVYLFEKVATFCRYKFSSRLANLSYSNFENPTILNQLESVRRCIDEYTIPSAFITSINLISSLLGVIALSISLCQYSYFLVLLCLLGIIPQFISQVFFKKKNYRFKEEYRSLTRKNRYLINLFLDPNVVREMRAFNNSSFFREKWITNNQLYIKKGYQKKRKESIINFLVAVIENIGLLLSVILIFVLISKGLLLVSVFGSCFFAFFSLQNMSKILADNLTNYYEKILVVNDYFEFFKNDNLKSGLNIKIDTFNSCIEFENVSFKYAEDSPYTFNNLNCKIKKGDKIAIVGPNGGGKSTFIKLLLNTYKPTIGQVKLDNVNIENYDSNDFYKLISYMGQDYVKYNFSLKENIELQHAKNSNKNFDKHKFVDLLGLECIMSKCEESDLIGKPFGKVDLSEGEWQKLAIARGVYNNGEIIVLDEPTAHLDSLSEINLLNIILNLCVDKTLILVTHRLRVCPYMDKIFYFDKEKSNIGLTHEELMKQNPKYKEMYNEQFN